MSKQEEHHQKFHEDLTDVTFFKNGTIHIDSFRVLAIKHAGITFSFDEILDILGTWYSISGRRTEILNRIVKEEIVTAIAEIFEDDEIINDEEISQSND